MIAAAVVTVGIVPWVGAEANGGRHGDDRDDKLLFFAADGLQQATVAKYADQGAVPGFRDLLRKGARASDHGLLTQAPPNTGAGWFTLTTGAGPGVAGSTNNTFHVNGQPFANRTGAFGTSRSTARPTAASTSARRSSGAPTRAPTRRCGWRRSGCATAT